MPMRPDESRYRWIRCLLIIVSWVLGLDFAMAEPNIVSGYVQDVRAERRERVVEMLLVPKPTDSGPELSARIFDDQLTREFRSQYELKFGLTEAQRIVANPSRYEEYEYSIGKMVTVEEDQANRRSFAEYMLRRMAEHHVDQYARSNPSVRPVYELKERIANVSVQMKRGYRLRFRYSYSGNYLDLRVENPYDLDAKVSFRMDPSKFGPTEVQEAIVSLGKKLTPKVTLTSQWSVEDGVFSMIGSKSLSPNLSTSLTGSTNTHEQGKSVRQDLVLVGLSWSN